jgi:hypothetical protein
MARNDADVSNDDMRTISMQAMSLNISLLQGKSRPLIQCLNQVFKSYEGSLFAKSEKDCLEIRTDLARVVASQSVKQDRQAALIKTCQRIAGTVEADPDFNAALSRLSAAEVSILSSANDQYLRLGMLQFRIIAENLGFFNSDKPSDILLEQSIVCTDRQGTTPGVYNDLLPISFFASYVTYKHLRELLLTRNIAKSKNDEGPAL